MHCSDANERWDVADKSVFVFGHKYRGDLFAVRKEFINRREIWTQSVFKARDQTSRAGRDWQDRFRDPGTKMHRDSQFTRSQSKLLVNAALMSVAWATKRFWWNSIALGYRWTFQKRLETVSNSIKLMVFGEIYLKWNLFEIYLKTLEILC